MAPSFDRLFVPCFVEWSLSKIGDCASDSCNCTGVRAVVVFVVMGRVYAESIVITSRVDKEGGWTWQTDWNAERVLGGKSAWSLCFLGNKSWPDTVVLQSDVVLGARREVHNVNKAKSRGQRRPRSRLRSLGLALHFTCAK